VTAGLRLLRRLLRPLLSPFLPERAPVCGISLITATSFAGGGLSRMADFPSLRGLGPSPGQPAARRTGANEGETKRSMLDQSARDVLGVRVPQRRGAASASYDLLRTICSLRLSTVSPVRFTPLASDADRAPAPTGICAPPLCGGETSL
jgi:hypothetical protein